MNMGHRKLVAALLALLLGTATLPAQASVRLHGHIIHEGDSAAAVLGKVGQPSRVIRLVNEHDAVVGKKWIYMIDGYNAKVITIELRGGVVASTATELLQ